MGFLHDWRVEVSIPERDARTYATVVPHKGGAVYVEKVLPGDTLVREIVKDPEAYVAETRRRARKRAKETRAVILQTAKLVSAPSDILSDDRYRPRHSS